MKRKKVLSCFAAVLVLFSAGCEMGNSGSAGSGSLIGTAREGGLIAYIFEPGDPGYVEGEIHGLIISTDDLSSGGEWISGGSAIATTLNGNTSKTMGSGKTNTTAIVNQSGCTGGAAWLCDTHTNTDTGTGIYSDWYLPSIEELEKLKPARTAIKGFSEWYWSSSEWDSSLAYGLRLSDPAKSWGGYYKTFSPPSDLPKTRAVRSF